MKYNVYSLGPISSIFYTWKLPSKNLQTVSNYSLLNIWLNWFFKRHNKFIHVTNRTSNTEVDNTRYNLNIIWVFYVIYFYYETNFFL